MNAVDLMQPDHERIWLQSAADANDTEGRMWCQDKVWPESVEDHEPTEYVRADLYAAKDTALAEMAAENEQRKEWQDAIIGLCKAIGSDDMPWGGDKSGWGFIFYFVKHLHTRATAAEAALALARKALEQIELVAKDRSEAARHRTDLIAEIAGGALASRSLGPLLDEEVGR